MAANEEAEAWREEFKTWYEQFGIYAFLEDDADGNGTNWAEVQKMNPNLVWTSHGTCEDSQISPGADLFRGKCCWVSDGWYIGNVPWDDGDTWLKATFYSWCPSCNPEGEEDDPESEDCPGDENFPDCECDGGWINYYFD